MTTFSTATVATSRPQRFGKQLVSHLGRRNGGEWSEETETGWIQLGTGRAEISCTPGALLLRVEGAAEAIPELEDVVGRHLVRFDADNALAVSWERPDGPGSRQPQPD